MNYIQAPSYSANISFDGSTLSVSVNLKQWIADVGFVGNPAVLFGAQAFDNHGNFIVGSSGSLSGSVLTVTIPSVPADGWKSITAGMGF